MAKVQNGNTNAESDAANAKKRKGFWSNVFGRSSNNTDENKDDQQPKRNGFMNSLMNNARQAATREVTHVAEHEAMKQVEAHNNGPQPTDANTTTTAANVAPDPSTAMMMMTTTTTPSDVLSAPTNWAKRMVDSAQQKVQGLQSLAS